jgi:hypothetical protein
VGKWGVDTTTLNTRVTIPDNGHGHGGRSEDRGRQRPGERVRGERREGERKQGTGEVDVFDVKRGTQSIRPHTLRRLGVLI